MGSNCVCGQRQTILATSIPIQTHEVYLTKQTSSSQLNITSLPKRGNTFKVKHKAPVIDERRRRSDEVKEPSSASVSDKIKTEADKKMIRDALSNHFILKNLDEDSLRLVIEHMRFYTINPREIIFTQGEPGFIFYVLCTGRVELIINGARKAVINAGSGFGELALLDDRPRSGTIKTLERCTLWGVDRTTFKEAIKIVNALNLEENKNFLDSVPLLNQLTSEQKDGLLASLVTEKWSSGQSIVKEGDTGDHFYIIKEGCVSCSQKETEIRQMFKGDFFGEQALLYNSPRTATITAISEVKVVSIGRHALMDVLGSNLQQILYKNTQMIAMDKSPNLKNFSKEQKGKIINIMRIQNFSSGEVIIPRGANKGAFLWIILRGSVRGLKEKLNILTCIGDDFLVNPTEEKYEIDYIAETDVDIAEISKEEIENCVGGNIAEIHARNEALAVIKRVQLLKGLTEDKYKELIRMLKIVEFNDKDTVVEQGEPGSSFFIIKCGRVDVIRNGEKLRSITKHDYFGERSILFNDTRSATVKADGSVTCWMLEKNDFLEIIDEGIQQMLLSRIELQDDTIELSELVPIKLIGKGVLGSVFLTCHRTKNTLYALKTVTREKISYYGVYDSIVLERTIMMQLDHIMIMKLIKTFKDQHRIYFLEEYVKGQDLFDVLRHIGILSDADAKFYTASLVLIIEHLHERDIIYRDFKPENIMIDDIGYTKLIDFGTSRILKGRSYTTVGTPHYMAPEIIKGVGYGLSVDWWSLGVMLYEFLYGSLPFGEEENDPIAVFECILEYRLIFPSENDPMSPSRQLIQQLLNKNPGARTGGNLGKLKEHRWFSSFSWDSLLLRKIKSPYVPKIEIDTNLLEKAIRKNKTLEAAIQKVEGKDDFRSSGIIMKDTPAPPDWDSEF
ncbi:PKG_2 [Blepharisma stoltei]|uniref:cGMP-dependent protein kinase n=1 Tax=Blepharisma stoltei TaxID=1481888 RepID=A0AAU9ITF8_9CILI|nr:unnamed protein product [Blepharisma stoltei]